MREGNIRYGYRIVLLDLFKSKLFKGFPTEKEIKEFVAKRFPTFHVDGDPVTWRIDRIYFLED